MEPNSIWTVSDESRQYTFISLYGVHISHIAETDWLFIFYLLEFSIRIDSITLNTDTHSWEHEGIPSKNSTPFFNLRNYFKFFAITKLGLFFFVCVPILIVLSRELPMVRFETIWLNTSYFFSETNRLQSHLLNWRQISKFYSLQENVC